MPKPIWNFAMVDQDAIRAEGQKDLRVRRSASVCAIGDGVEEATRALTVGKMRQGTGTGRKRKRLAPSETVGADGGEDEHRGPRAKGRAAAKKGKRLSQLISARAASSAEQEPGVGEMDKRAKKEPRPKTASRGGSRQLKIPRWVKTENDRLLWQERVAANMRKDQERADAKKALREQQKAIASKGDHGREQEQPASKKRRGQPSTSLSARPPSTSLSARPPGM